MDSFWVKIAILGAVVIGLIVLVKTVKLPESQPEPEKTVADVLKQKEAGFREDPQPIEQDPAEEVEQTVSDEVNQPLEAPVIEPPAAPQFAKLSEIEAIEAEQILEQAITFRKTAHISRGAGYKTTVELCRKLISKFPDSEYAFKAKRILNDIPDRFKELHHVTEEETELGNYK